MTPSHSHRLAAGLIGGFAMAAFVGLSETLAGLNIVFGKGYTYSSPGEVYFWLGHALLLFPGACLLCPRRDPATHERDRAKPHGSTRTARGPRPRCGSPNCGAPSDGPAC